MRTRILANGHGPALSLTFGGQAVTAAGSRTLAGDLVVYGAHGRTSAGLLRVRPGALRFPDDLARVKLTREHDRSTSRGVLATVHDGPERMRVTVTASSGPDGDDAIREAQDRTRDAFSFDVVDYTVDGDEITDGLVIAIGQVGIPAYDDARIDTIAASNHPGVPMLTEAQRARLNELLALTNRTADQAAELQTLLTAAGAPETPPADAPAADPAPAPAAPPAAPVPPPPPAEPQSSNIAASAVPSGVPGPAGATTSPRGGALREMIRDLTAALHPSRRNAAAITAALSDITSTDHTANISAPAWSGELWSGLQYVPEFSDLLNQGTLTNWEGRGWRFTSKLAIQDYDGDKAAIPTDTVTTEDSSYEAARAAVGVDVDRKFYDFPDEGFVTALVEQVRESWEILKDGKVKDYILAQAVASTRAISVGKTNGDATITAAAGTFKASDVGAPISGSGIPASTTILSVTNSGSAEMSANATNGTTVTATLGVQEGSVLKAAARAALTLKRRRVGRPSWIVMNDEDMFSLMDVDQDHVPAFLNLWGIDPANFRTSVDVPSGTVIAGVKQAAVFRELPGSPIRVSAQHLANGGIDEAFFGYWAIEEHHTSGIATVTYRAA